MNTNMGYLISESDPAGNPAQNVFVVVSVSLQRPGIKDFLKQSILNQKPIDKIINCPINVGIVILH